MALVVYTQLGETKVDEPCPVFRSYSWATPSARQVGFAAAVRALSVTPVTSPFSMPNKPAEP